MATVLAVLTGLLAWRLSEGPVQLDFIAPTLENALSQPDRGYLVRFAGISLDTKGGFALTARDARIVSPEGTVLASSPQVRLGISRPALLRGVLAPSSVDLADVRVRLYRTVAGSLRFTLADSPSESAEADTEPPEFDLSDFLREPDPEKSTGYLRRLRVIDGAVMLIDERSGTVWRAPGANFSIERDQQQITAGLGTTINAPGGGQRLDASGRLDLASGEAWLDLRIGGLRLARLAPLMPAMEHARAIDMAFDATASARFGAGGSLKQARFQVSGRDGVLRLPQPGATPVPVRMLDIAGSVGPDGDVITIEEFSASFETGVIEARGSATLGDDVRIEGKISKMDSAVVAALMPSPEHARRISLPLEGDFAAKLSEEGELDQVGLELRGTGGELTLATEPVRVEQLSVSATLDGSSGEIVMPNLLLDLGGPIIEASGRTGPADDGWRVGGEAIARDVPVDALDRLWPPDLAPGARRWITENLSGGRVTEARVTVDTSTSSDSSAEGKEQVSGSLAFEGVTARYWKPLPPFQDVSGGATFAGRVFDVQLQTGRLGGIQLQKGRVLLSGLGLEAGKEVGDIDVTFTGPFSEILTVLDNPPLGYAKWLKVDPAQVGGRAEARISVELPLLDDLSIDDVHISASAELSDASVPGVALGQDLTEADLSLKVDKTELQLSGEGELAGMGVRLDVAQKFEGEGSGLVQVSGVVSDSARLAIAPALVDHVSGPVPMRLKMTEGPESPRIIEAEFDLARAALTLPLDAWSKDAGVPGNATVRVEMDGERLVRIEHFEVNAGTGYVTGSGTMSADGSRVERVEIDRLRLGDRTDLGASVGFAADGSLTIHISGATADLSPIMRRRGAPGANDTESEGSDRHIQVDAALGQLWIGPDYPLLDFDGHVALEGNNLRGGEARGEIGEGNLAHLVLGEEGGERKLRLTIDDTGTALRALGWVDSVSGGRLQVVAARKIAPADAPWRGKVESGTFRISGAPLAARILAAASFTGLADLSSRDAGITFDKLEAPFVWGEGPLKLEPGRAYGGALGVTFFGSVDMETDVIDIAGTIVPAYALNRVLGSIPLLGNLLTGEKGSGLFAATYRARGLIDEPDVSVNPLAALAPGFLRNLFGEIAGGGPADPEVFTDPAAERFPGNLN